MSRASRHKARRPAPSVSARAAVPSEAPGLRAPTGPGPAEARRDGLRRTVLLLLLSLSVCGLVAGAVALLLPTTGPATGPTAPSPEAGAGPAGPSHVPSPLATGGGAGAAKIGDGAAAPASAGDGSPLPSPPPASPPPAAAQPAGAAPGPLRVLYPEEGAIFPPEIAPPRFHWTDGQQGSAGWQVSLLVPGRDGPLRQETVASGSLPGRRPSAETWREAVTAALESTPDGGLVLEVRRLAEEGRPGEAAPPAAGSPDPVRVRFTISRDPVGAPIFYREVPLPFRHAYLNMDQIRWRLGDISSPRLAPAVLENLPVCGNCHSFSRDGRVLGMDVDYANDKGAYAVAEVEPVIRLTRDKIVTWNDFRREDGEMTYGLLAQVSPDGRHVVSTVKDRSLFIPVDDLWYSQLFFPAKGILAVYDRVTRKFAALPGADDPAYVQSNPPWSPDGESIIFARAPIQRAVLEAIGPISAPVLEGGDYSDDRYRIRYDLYRIPFDQGRGGRATPIPGASGNGRSNYFARISPDGKWIVFCQADRAMLLQRDSKLYIMPATGGTPRLMRCNGEGLNSWHSWSPSGRWLVFASKRNTAYTQLFLTHVDEQGQDSPAILLEHFSPPDRAANIPEFAALAPGSLLAIREAFMDDYSHARLARRYAFFGEHERSEEESERTLALNPRNIEAHLSLGLTYTRRGELSRASRSFQTILDLDPPARQAALARQGLGSVHVLSGRLDEAIQELQAARRLDPANVMVTFTLARLLLGLDRVAEAIPLYEDGLKARPDLIDEHKTLAGAYLRQRNPARARELYRHVLELKPDDQEAADMLARLTSATEPAEGASPPAR